MSPGNQILALTARKANPKRLTIAKGKTLVLMKPNNQKSIKSIITCLREFLYKKNFFIYDYFFWYFALTVHKLHFYLSLYFFLSLHLFLYQEV